MMSYRPTMRKDAGIAQIALAFSVDLFVIHELHSIRPKGRDSEACGPYREQGNMQDL